MNSRSFSNQRTGIAAIEVALALVLLALALVPMIGALDGTRREAAHTGRHLLAHLRVQALLDAAEATDIRWPGAAGDVTELPVPALAGQVPDALAKGTAEYTEKLELEALEDGLVALRARVSFRAALATGGPAKPHDAVSIRMLARPDRSWLQKVDDSATAGTAAPRRSSNV